MARGEGGERAIHGQHSEVLVLSPLSHGYLYHRLVCAFAKVFDTYVLVLPAVNETTSDTDRQSKETETLENSATS